MLLIEISALILLRVIAVVCMLTGAGIMVMGPGNMFERGMLAFVACVLVIAAMTSTLGLADIMGQLFGLVDIDVIPDVPEFH